VATKTPYGRGIANIQREGISHSLRQLNCAWSSVSPKFMFHYGRLSDLFDRYSSLVIKLTHDDINAMALLCLTVESLCIVQLVVPCYKVQLVDWQVTSLQSTCRPSWLARYVYLLKRFRRYDTIQYD